jgi:hypothetical protein
MANDVHQARHKHFEMNMGEPTRNRDQEIPARSGEDMGEGEPLNPPPGPEREEQRPTLPEEETYERGEERRPAEESDFVEYLQAQLSTTLRIDEGRASRMASFKSHRWKHMRLRVSSPAFSNDSQNASPPLESSGIPQQSKSVAVICDHPDAPSGTFTCWLLHDVLASTHDLGDSNEEAAYREGDQRNPKRTKAGR